MQKSNRPKVQEPPGSSPDPQPAPLSTESPEQRSSSLPHLVDLNHNRISIASHQHDKLYWNSTLEERGNEPVPEYDALGKVGENGRSYWVKRNSQDTPTAGDDGENRPPDEARLPAPQDSSTGDKSRSNPSPTSVYSDDDDGDTPARSRTPLWRKRPNFLSRKRGSSVSESVDLFVGQSERARNSYLGRGGGETVEPVPFRGRMSPSVRRGVEGVAREDPMREGVWREYRTVPSVAHEGGEEDVVGMGSGRDSLFMKWDPEAPRPSTEELENAYGRYPSRGVSLVHGEENEQLPKEPDNSEDHKLGERIGGDQFVTEESKSKGEGADYIHSPTPVKPINGKSPLPPINGVPIDISPDWPPTHALSTPPPNTRRNSSRTSFHPIFHISPTPSSITSTSTSHTHPFGLASLSEVEAYLQTLPRPTYLLKTLALYERTLATQSKSILHLHHQIDSLTQKTEYYEHTLLPQTLTHWTSANKENHAISTALRSAEEENAMLWGLLVFSRKVLSLCWERDEAVLGTARMMRVREGNRGKVSVLERLVGSFGAGRGGEGGKKGRGKGKKGMGGKEKERARTRGKSPGREDLEQLIFVCEQNLRVLGEDLEDWGENLRVIHEGREKEREEEDGEKDE